MYRLILFLTLSVLFLSPTFAQKNKASTTVEKIIDQANVSGKPLMLIIDDHPNRPAAYSRFFQKPVWVVALYEKKFFKTVKEEFHGYFASSSNPAMKEILAQKTDSEYPAYFFFNRNGILVYQASGILAEQEMYQKLLDKARIAISESIK